MTGVQNTKGAADKSANPVEATLHGSCVAVAGRGLLILGASGSGKSGLALALMAIGAGLVADDRVILTRTAQTVIASVPDPIAGLIEARGIGLLHARPLGPTPVVCVVDLDQTETDRMPPPRKTDLLGQSVPLKLKVDTPHFHAMLMQYLKQGCLPE